MMGGFAMHDEDRKVSSQIEDQVIQETNGEPDAVFLMYSEPDKYSPEFSCVYPFRSGDFDGREESVTGYINELMERMELEAVLVNEEELEEKLGEYVDELVSYEKEPIYEASSPVEDERFEQKVEELTDLEDYSLGNTQETEV